jgi:hypothetical protein
MGPLLSACNIRISFALKIRFKDPSCRQSASLPVARAAAVQALLLDGGMRRILCGQDPFLHRVPHSEVHNATMGKEDWEYLTAAGVYNPRYALMLVCMACGALLANGATGPLAALTTLLLPPEFKSFALSVYEFLTGLLAPMYSVIMGVGLQVRGLLLDPMYSVIIMIYL